MPDPKPKPARTSASKTPLTKTAFSDAGDASATASAATSQPQPQTFSDGGPLPKLLVFDLDYTLWPFWVDTHVSPPVRPTDAARTALRDRSSSTFTFYPEVPAVLAACERRGIKVAAASRTSAPELADEFLRTLQIVGGPQGSDSAAEARADGGGSRSAKSYFSNLQIFPGNKVSHFRKIKEQLGVEYDEMVFFDDETRNRNVEKELGVAFVLVNNGTSLNVVDQGVRMWRRRRGLQI